MAASYFFFGNFPVVGRQLLCFSHGNVLAHEAEQNVSFWEGLREPIENTECIVEFSREHQVADDEAALHDVVFYGGASDLPVHFLYCGFCSFHVIGRAA